jgi:transposase InsO family protein
MVLAVFLSMRAAQKHASAAECQRSTGQTRGKVFTQAFSPEPALTALRILLRTTAKLTGSAKVTLERAKELHPDSRPRIISDNGPQFIAKDFKEFIRISGMTHVRTSPYYPQSNGKIERWHKSLKGECIRPRTPLSLDDARRLVEGYVQHYNNVRLNSAIGYITPTDMLAGRQQEIHAERDRKLEEARKQRQIRRQQAA